MFKDLVPTIIKAFATVAAAGVILGGTGYFVGKEAGKKEAAEASQKTATPCNNSGLQPKS